MIERGRGDRFVDPLHQAIKTVAGLNLIYFGLEFAVALAIGSVSLFADSIDFLEDAAVSGLILMALGWSARSRALVGMAMAVILLVPGAATAWMAWQKFILPVPPPDGPNAAKRSVISVTVICSTAACHRLASPQRSVTREHRDHCTVL